MKPLKLLTPLALGLPLFALAVPVESRISAATVYSDRAVITRTAQIDLGQGESALVFEKLPSNLMDQSLQVSAHGTAAATILDVNGKTTYVETAPEPRVKELNDELLDLNRQVRALDDRAGVLNEERDFVKGMMKSSTGSFPANGNGGHGVEAGARPTLDDWQKLYGYSDETLGKIAAELASIDEKRADIAGKRGAINQQLELYRSVQGMSIKEVTVRMSVASAGRLEVTLKYSVPGANWAPSYDARLHADSREVELSYFGMVRNATGEDWDNISLTLSTARPGLGGGAPELPPWVVDVRQREEATILAPFTAEKVLAGSRVRTDLKNGNSTGGAVTDQYLADSGAPAPVPVDMAALEQSAAVQTNATSATFQIPSSVSVPANNSLQKVSIASAKLPAVVKYDATPKASEVAYLSAESSNSTDYPLLTGSMNTFLDDTFIATSRLKTVMPGEKFDLHLGADEGIAIKRRLVSRFAENTGITNSGARITYEYLVTITNNKKLPEKVEFKEPLPVSRQEKIVVRLISPEAESVGSKASPKEVTREEDGKLVWRLNLNPGEKREIPLKFSISYPTDLDVTGLE